MAMRPGPRQPVGSAAWIAEERSSALQIACSEVEEFSFSARNEVDWLNEHMAEIFSENQINVAEVFKTPGKLRGKTPRTARKAKTAEARAPLSDIFSATPKTAPNPFAMAVASHAQTPKLKIAQDKPARTPNIPASSPKHAPAKEAIPATDSGYHGSQETVDFISISKEDTEPVQAASPGKPAGPLSQDALSHPQGRESEPSSPTQQSSDETFQSAKEEQTKTAKFVSPTRRVVQEVEEPVPEAPEPSPTLQEQPASPKKSPVKASPQKSSPVKSLPEAQAVEDVHDVDMDVDNTVTQVDEARSPSDGSSPIRPIVRKSSLNFASLPAREPLTSNKSLGARMSRISHIDQTRTSYYNRHTGGKSLGHAHFGASDEENDDMDIDEDAAPLTDKKKDTVFTTHSKSYTQRLQDQISMLGKSQANGPRPSKSIPHLGGSQPNSFAVPVQQSQTLQSTAEVNHTTSPRKEQIIATPGAFPEDDDDDWIAPPTTVSKAREVASPRPAIPKSYSTDIMEGVHGKDSVSGHDFVLPKQRQQEGKSQSPRRPPAVPERTGSGLGHSKSASVPALPNYEMDIDEDVIPSPKKGISVSNPALPPVPENERPGTPGTPRSPSRGLRESPLKQVKNKLSSILKSSKGLLASSAALSAEGKSSLLSPSKLHLHAGPSTESLQQTDRDADPFYPDLTRQVSETQSVVEKSSPSRPNGRRTRASAEREKREQKEKEKETKEAKRLADQMDKLERAREKEREKARVFSKEQDKVAAMEKQMTGHREQEKATPAPPPKDQPKPTRTSPRKAKAQQEAEARAAMIAAQRDELADNEVEMIDAPSTMPPPRVPRSATAGQASKGREIRRPIKPSREPLSKPKQLPTVIRVNTSSQQPQFHPSNSVLAATLQDTLGGPQQQLKSKASQQSLHGKPSLQSLKSSVSSSGRPKALELAAKRKEQEEREAQRKREAKAEIERKRAAIQEEERKQEQQRRLEAEKQKEREREAVEAKKNAQRQAAIERAKQTRAPPPAVRSQLNGPSEQGTAQDRLPRPSYQHNDQGPARPPSRMTSTMHRSQEELNRPVNAVLSNATKSTSKRPLQDGNEDGGSRPTMPRNGPSYQKEVKRMRMTDEFEQESGIEVQASQPNIKGPPVRPSAGFKKDMPTKSLFPNGYTNAPQGVTRDLFKATVTAQHNTQVKAAHPLDMAQVSKSAIPFASNPNPAGAAAAHKTPARPAGMAANKSAAKSAAKSSPRYQNGDAIELPEIQTDDEDEEDDDHIGVAPWADSPDLRRALMRQEGIDPMQIFGPPAPINMEEVFSKSKDRWHKFRARTSSANWSGTDRLTEDDIRKDLAARDKIRREGGWSYDLGKEVV